MAGPPCTIVTMLLPIKRVKLSKQKGQLDNTLLARCLGVAGLLPCKHSGFWKSKFTLFHWFFLGTYISKKPQCLTRSQGAKKTPKVPRNTTGLKRVNSRTVGTPNVCRKCLPEQCVKALFQVLLILKTWTARLVCLQLFYAWGGAISLL